MLRIKELYQEVCNHTPGLYQMTSDERIRIQAHLRKMYLDIEKVCDSHNLTIMTAYGTVLGALRHKGFIPWDDDLDLIMPRDDYDKFIQKYANDLPSKYKVYAPNSPNGPICRFAKVVDTTTRFLEIDTPDDEKHGAFIDIFPMENAPKNNFVVRFRRFISCVIMFIASSVADRKVKNSILRKLLSSSLKGKISFLIRDIIGFLFCWKTEEEWYNVFDRYTNYKKKTGLYCVPSGEGGKYKYFMPLPGEDFLPTQKMPFDDIEVYVPNNPIHHCEIEYGDWKKIPPEEDRWQHYIYKLEL